MHTNILEGIKNKLMNASFSPFSVYDFRNYRLGYIYLIKTREKSNRKRRL
jgi:hypothetical protein